jgi:hypothetical protein
MIYVVCHYSTFRRRNVIINERSQKNTNLFSISFTIYNSLTHARNPDRPLSSLFFFLFKYGVVCRARSINTPFCLRIHWQPFHLLGTLYNFTYQRNKITSYTFISLFTGWWHTAHIYTYHSLHTRTKHKKI